MSVFPTHMLELTDHWRAEIPTLERNGYVEAARTLARCVVDIETYRPTDRTLSLREAARASGYTYNHLWRLVRDGRVTNVGSGRSIMVRSSELPRKAGTR